ncbi:MAG: alpha/beta hydrolase [Burkholderiales bacterium]|nr:MAG: alpha/beta hydrolase [Burkholderiales bacterium]
MTPTPALPPPVPGAVRRDLVTSAGRIALWCAGDGPPMLLVHSINAAASAYEVRPIFEAMRRTHRVYAPDLPGFGASERGDRPYSVAMYVAAIEASLDAIAAERGAAPVDVLALSLSSEFAARVAAGRPGRVRTLTMVTPTGLDRRSASLRAPPGTDREVPGMHRIVSFPLWSQGLFDALVSRRSVRYFLGRTWGSKSIDEGLFEYSWASAHQPGARFAPLAFLSARLFSKDIRDVYERLAMPVWVPHGTRGDFRDFSGADWTASRPNWRLRAFESGALPHFEHPEAFEAALRTFVAST